MKKLLNVLQEREIVHSYLKNENTKKLAESYEVSQDTIRRTLSRKGVLKTKIDINKKINIWNHYEVSENSCWEWTLSLRTDGYGQFCVEGKMHGAHVLAYEVHNKTKVSRGLLVCHTCDNPKCINPDHLFLGTHQDNKNDCVGKHRHSRGEKVNTSKLDEKQVMEIRKIYEKGNKNQKELGIIYGVSQVQISSIIRKQSWSHI